MSIPFFENFETFSKSLFYAADKQKSAFLKQKSGQKPANFLKKF